MGMKPFSGLVGLGIKGWIFLVGAVAVVTGAGVFGIVRATQLAVPDPNGAAGDSGSLGLESSAGAMPDLPSPVATLETATTPENATPEIVTPPGTEMAPNFLGIVRWLNSEPISLEEQRGKVVLIDFWTYS